MRIVIIQQKQASSGLENRLRSKDFSLEILKMNPLGYHEDLDEFYKLRDCAMVIVAQDPLDQKSALYVFYAMVLRKPIILLKPPQFAPGVDGFTKEAILRRMNRIMLYDLDLLEDAEFDTILKVFGTESVNYVLNKHERALVSSKLRGHFRKLLSKETAEADFSNLYDFLKIPT